LLPSDNSLLNTPQIVNERQRWLKGIEEIVLSLTAKGLTTEEVAPHFPGYLRATPTKDTISRIADKVIGEMTEWCNRPLTLLDLVGEQSQSDLAQALRVDPT
jgi:transposase-like protein